MTHLTYILLLLSVCNVLYKREGTVAPYVCAKQFLLYSLRENSAHGSNCAAMREIISLR